MKRSTPLFILWISVFFVFIACSKETPENTETPVTRNDCQGISDLNLHLGGDSQWLWLGVAVGNTQEQELITKLGEPTNISHWPTKEQYVACIYRYRLDDSPTFWIAGDKVIGIGFSKSTVKFNLDGLPGTLREAHQLYGRPEMVGWSSIYSAGYRSVVWLSKGIQAEVFINKDNLIANILFFAPMAETEFNKSVWSRLVLYTNPTLNSDNIDTLPRDPFDW